MSTAVDEVVEGPETLAELVSVLSASRPAILLSIDVGTSGVRASLFNESGDEITGSRVISRRKSNSFSAFGELNPDLIFDQLVETIDQLFSNSIHASSQIRYVSISCFWHSLMGVDASGKPTTPLLTWADTRASQLVAQLRANFDEGAIHTRTGSRFHASYWPAKLVWLKTEQPETYQKTSQWLGLSEYLTLRLFGDASVSVSMASATGLFNQANCDWDWEFVDQLHISRESMPKITDTTTQAHLRDEYAQRWPALNAATLSAVVGDGAANNIGGGCCNRNRVALMVGTSGAMRLISEGAPPQELRSELWCYRVDRSRVIVGGALSDGGGLYRWLTDLMSLVDSVELESDLSRMKPDSHGLTVLPFWSGERSTGWSANARGGIFGLTQDAKPAEIVRAALEGIAYRFALIARALDTIAPLANVVATGNALRSSPTWLQILSDVLGRPLMYGGSPEASIRGAALLALESVGKIASIEDVTVAVDAVFEPDMDRHAVYQRALARQEDLYQRLIGN
ncbi:MAG: carbohydrate kinase [Blastocatellia bacterium]|nr:MAG: carbohydrate kinase [Blastocatellia bacterium]